MSDPIMPFTSGFAVPNGFFSMPPAAAAAPAERLAVISSPAPKRRQRKRLKPGERRVQILQTLAHMLEDPNNERITTAQLAARLQISEAALYRHFASKTQMFEALIELMESYVNSLIGETVQTASTGAERAMQLATRLLSFAEENPGLSRILTGSALVYENKRLLARMNALLERFEAALHQCLQASGAPDSAIRTELLAAFVFGRIHVWSRSDFTHKPTVNLAACLARLTA
jgi:TetR/AcrR family transcriptional regulator